MESKHTKNFKRDGSHETPQDHRTTADGPTRTPTDRALRYAKRSRVIEDQAAEHEKKATAPAHDRNFEEEAKLDVCKERNDTPQPRVPTNPRNQSPAPASQQDQPHSGLENSSESRAQPPTKISNEGLRPEHYSAYRHHAVRESNQSYLIREKKQKIKFPPSNDAKWKEVDGELAI